MLPNFGAMQEGLGAIIALIERIAVALERIADHLDEIHDDIHSGTIHPHTAHPPLRDHHER